MCWRKKTSCTRGPPQSPRAADLKTRGGSSLEQNQLTRPHPDEERQNTTITDAAAPLPHTHVCVCVCRRKPGAFTLPEGSQIQVNVPSRISAVRRPGRKPIIPGFLQDLSSQGQSGTRGCLATQMPAHLVLSISKPLLNSKIYGPCKFVPVVHAAHLLFSFLQGRKQLKVLQLKNLQL